jgi:hypothetical protein
LAEVDPYFITEKFHDLRARLERKEWLEELGACQAYHDGNNNRRLAPANDFLGLAAQYGHKEYLKYVFNDPSEYTSTYKNYLLVCGTMPRMTPRTMTAPFTRFAGNNLYSPYWTRQVLARWLEIVNYLLFQGCKSELAIFHNSFDPYGVYKLTGLEAFLWSLPTLFRPISWDDDPVPCDLIIEMLRHFSESGADFMQPVYGYYGRAGLFIATYTHENLLFGPCFPAELRRLTSSRRVVVE